MHYVLDSSVVIKWYLRENLSDEARHLKDRIRERSQVVAVPRLFFVESANILWKKCRLVKEIGTHDAKGIYAQILDLPLHIIEDDEILLKALNLSLEHSVSIYDAVYLACALRTNVTLVTADAAFTKRIKDPVMQKHVHYIGTVSRSAASDKNW